MEIHWEVAGDTCCPLPVGPRSPDVHTMRVAHLSLTTARNVRALHSRCRVAPPSSRSHSATQGDRSPQRCANDLCYRLPRAFVPPRQSNKAKSLVQGVASLKVVVSYMLNRAAQAAAHGIVLPAPSHCLRRRSTPLSLLTVCSEVRVPSGRSCA